MPKGRSPDYPAITLTECIEAARALWKKEKRTAITADVAAKDIGYSSLSGPARTKLATLKKYGLMEGDFKSLRLSDLAITILHSEAGSQPQIQAIRDAAMRPHIFQELARTHLHASDDALRSYLIVTKRFTDVGANHLVRSFKDAVTVAKLEDSVYAEDINPTETDDMLDEEPDYIKRQREKLKELGFVTEKEAAQQELLKSFPIRLSRQNQAVLRFTRLPVDRDDLKLIKSFIDLMEKTFTESPQGAQIT